MSSVDLQEIAHFSKDSVDWWDESGPFAPLHRINPVRLSYIKQRICKHLRLDYYALDSLKGINILDIGCGGGLVCEPLARMGANVTGVDADSQAIDVARKHAKDNNLKILYKNQAAEDITEKYDVVLALEVIEHVQDPAQFVKMISRLVRPNGIVIFSTLNRNPRSFLLGVVAAEYILQWVPKGTHSWKKFIKPSELARMVRKTGLSPRHHSGIVYRPLKRQFVLNKSDLGLNYLLTAKKC